VARDKRIVRVNVQPSSTAASGATARLSVVDESKVNAWISVFVDSAV
jgi:hypothetical protein